jgi:hypothetical protein
MKGINRGCFNVLAILLSEGECSNLGKRVILNDMIKLKAITAFWKCG